MITARFKSSKDGLYGFELSGHAMFNIEGPDIVCSAVSAMTNLVVNTLTEEFSAEVSTVIDGDEAKIVVEVDRVSLSNAFAVEGLIRGFRTELCNLKEEYPDNLEVL
jgi:uncharacterized protein YsxB (DUF464 family)